MSFKLKENVADFTVVDGPFAGREFRAGQIYAEVPPQEKEKFETVTKAETQAPGSKTATAAKKPEVTNG